MKSASTCKSLKDINDDLNLHEFFPETFIVNIRLKILKKIFFSIPFKSHSKSAPKSKELLPIKSSIQTRPRSIHIEHRERKYRITFLKDSSNQFESLPKLSRYASTTNENVLLIKQQNRQSLFGTESSTVQGLSTASTTTKIHRDSQLFNLKFSLDSSVVFFVYLVFPPLSLAALKEYRPTLTPKVSSATTTTTIKHPKQQQTRRKDMLKTDFIWEQSIVTPKT